MYEHILSTANTCGCNGYRNNDRYALFKENISKVIAMAVLTHKKFPVGTLCEEEDLIMVGLEALWDCTDKYNFSLNLNFWGYAKIRVSGAMIDQARNFDHVSRLNRKMLNKIERKRELLEQELQHAVTFEDVCISLGVDGDKSRELDEIRSFSFISLDASPLCLGESTETIAETIPDQNNVDPALSIDKEDDIVEVDKLLEKLSPQERSVIRLYFFSGILMRDISLAVNLTESRVKQILDKAIDKMREEIGSNKGLRSRLIGMV